MGIIIKLFNVFDVSYKFINKVLNTSKLKIIKDRKNSVDTVFKKERGFPSIFNKLI